MPASVDEDSFPSLFLNAHTTTIPPIPPIKSGAEDALRPVLRAPDQVRGPSAQTRRFAPICESFVRDTTLERVPEKWIPVFGKNARQTKL